MFVFSRRPLSVLHAKPCILLLLLMIASPALAEEAKHSARPQLKSLLYDPLTTAERGAAIEWALALPDVRRHVGDDRTRLLRAGADVATDDDGSRYRRLVIYLRNYDRGLVHRVAVRLDSGEVSVRDLRSLVQPSREEIAEAKSLIRSDRRLKSLVEDSELELSGGFFVRSRVLEDPCLSHICLEFHFVREGSVGGSVRRVIVDLTRRRLAHTDFPGLIDSRLPVSLTAAEEMQR